MDKKDLLDLKDSTLVLEGTKNEQEEISKKISEKVDDLKQDRQERVQVYTKRRDFYTGNHGQYSNITGIIKDTKNKKGHTNQVTNYAGRTVVKMAFGLANNPPSIIVSEEPGGDDFERTRAEAVEKFIDLTFRQNKFFKSSYRRAAFIQGEYGDAAIKTFPDGDKIKIINHENMGTIMVGWNGNPGEFDCVIAENYLTPKVIKDQYGIVVNEKTYSQLVSDNKDAQLGSWEQNNQWATKVAGKQGVTNLPSGKSKTPKLKVLEYDSDEYYAIKIEDKLVQLIYKDDIKYPKVKFWTVIPNIPNPPSPWSIADIDYLMDLNVELNENDNRSSDHLRVGNVQRYVAYNMSDFDPESLKTSSGQVIFVNDPDGRSKFEPLQTNINNFPDDQFNQRKLQQIFDMGLPKVNYGASGADSGRSKAIDYQSSIDLTTFKRDAWELALQDICEKIQTFGNFLHGDEQDWFTNDAGEFIIRNVEFDWADVLPVSQADKIVNIANKFNMIGLSLRQAYKELGYRDPEAMIKELEAELKNPDLMILRSKAWQLSTGLLEANNNAATMAATNGSETPPASGTPQATMLNSSQNGPRPMASKNGATTPYASAMGAIRQARQNTTAAGG